MDCMFSKDPNYASLQISIIYKSFPIFLLPSDLNLNL